MPQHLLLRYWQLADLLARFEFAFSELGLLREQPESPDRAVMELFWEEEICLLGTEIRRRQRARQEMDAARRDAHRRYPPAFIRRVKTAYDLRDHIARDLGLTKPITGNICSPFRHDGTPSFRVYPDHFWDLYPRGQRPCRRRPPAFTAAAIEKSAIPGPRRSDSQIAGFKPIRGLADHIHEEQEMHS